MGVFNGAVRSITAATNDDNWTLVGANTKYCRVRAAWASGEATSSTAMHTRHCRSSGQNGATTTGNVEKSSTYSAANGIPFGTTFASTQPSLESGDLLAFSWNCHGGIMYWHAGAPDEEWELVGASTNVNISSRNSSGTGTSSYGVTWFEN
jgi:hypothetical protein